MSQIRSILRYGHIVVLSKWGEKSEVYAKSTVLIGILKAIRILLLWLRVRPDVTVGGVFIGVISSN